MKTLATVVARLREWAEVESVPAQEEFDVILADLELLVRQEAELGAEVEVAGTGREARGSSPSPALPAAPITPAQVELLRLLAWSLKSDMNVDPQTRIMAGALHKSLADNG